MQEQVFFVELQDNHIDYLQQILAKKHKVLWRGGLLYIFITTLYNVPRILNWVHIRTKDKDLLIVPERINIFLIIHIMLELIIISGLMYGFFVHIRPLQKDVKNKSGMIVQKQIVRKSFFEHTNEYYFFFDDFKIPNKEVSQLDYSKYGLGDTYLFLIATNSGIQIDGFANYTLL